MWWCSALKTWISNIIERMFVLVTVLRSISLFTIVCNTKETGDIYKNHAKNKYWGSDYRTARISIFWMALEVISLGCKNHLNNRLLSMAAIIILKNSTLEQYSSILSFWRGISDPAVVAPFTFPTPTTLATQMIELWRRR